MDRKSPIRYTNRNEESFKSYFPPMEIVNGAVNNEMILKLLKSMLFFRVNERNVDFVVFFLPFHSAAHKGNIFSPFLFNCHAREGRF